MHPSVYSIVPPALMSVEAWHAAAILAGGDDACLCGPSAGWWAGVVEKRPAEIHVAVTGARRHLRGIRWHRLKLAESERDKLRDMPITALRRIPLDLASSMTVFELKRVLAELEYHHGVEPEHIRPALRRGYPGAAKLRRALDDHIPQLALTRSHLEAVFADFLHQRGFAQPEFNHPLGSSTVDAVYRDLRIAIELDGVKGHKGERRILRDHRRDLHRRADGMLPVRYHYTQIINPADQDLIEAELDRLGVPRDRVDLLPLSTNRGGPLP